ncbi:hypothetical protein L9F63_006047 [Diploptera punctata]|uniref:C-type lectin domain-containing protein n=1 Tax=Diploptera punctata TaxID=6984 RepID=A0AAD7ZBY9_DIPPU|nr:hypothetical protein L9F63_006047 [Diploptera punctata]
MFEYLVLVWVGVSAACSQTQFNFSISKVQNKSGRLYAQLNFNLVGELPLDFYFDNTNITNINVDLKIASSKSAPSFPEYKLPIIANTTPRAPPAGYKLLPQLGYYKVIVDAKPWQDALEDCEKQGAHLLILNSENEAQQIIDLIVQQGSTERELWVGLHDQFQNRNYVTVFNESLRATGYIKWYPGDPWGNKDQNCISFRYESRLRYGLRDWGCSLLYQYICEQEL